MLGPPASGKLMLPTRLRGTNSTYPVMLLSAINLLVSSFFILSVSILFDL